MRVPFERYAAVGDMLMPNIRLIHYFSSCRRCQDATLATPASIAYAICALRQDDAAYANTEYDAPPPPPLICAYERYDAAYAIAARVAHMLSAGERVRAAMLR